MKNTDFLLKITIILRKKSKKVSIFAYFAKHVSEYLFIMFNMDTLDSHSYSTNFKW